MGYATWTGSAEQHRQAFGLDKDTVEKALRKRIDDNAVEAYGNKGRGRTTIKLGKGKSFEVQFSLDAQTGAPWIQAIYAEPEEV